MKTPNMPTKSKRAPLKARPRKDFDANEAAQRLTERFSKSLEYLGR